MNRRERCQRPEGGTQHLDPSIASLPGPVNKDSYISSLHRFAPQMLARPKARFFDAGATGCTAGLCGDLLP